MMGHGYSGSNNIEREMIWEEIAPSPIANKANVFI